MENKKIFLLSTQRSDERTGVRFYCDALEEELLAEGFVVCRKTHHDAPRWLRLGCVLILKATRILGRGAQQVVVRGCIYIQACWVCRKMQNEVDSVFAQDPITGAAASQFFSKVWTTCHFSNPVDEIFRAQSMGGVAQWWIRKIMKFFLSRNQCFIVLSKSAEEMMQTYCPKAKYVVIPTLCRLKTFREMIPHEGFRIVMMGRLEPLKGQRLLIEIIAQLKDLPVEIWLLGEGEDHQRLIDLANQLAVMDKIKFFGFCKAPEEILSQCDLYIHTSKMEAFALAPIEAIFSGIPAWIMETPGCNDFSVFDHDAVFSQETGATVLALKVRECILNQKQLFSLVQYQQCRCEIFRPREVVSEYLRLI
ncbi:MAG: glycosyltransferase [Kiritimatiellia bacterium]